MSATFFGGEVKYTKRYRLGQLLSTLTRHFLLMTATPHNGKEEDFQLFMALLDGDRFEGRFRDGAHVADVSDLMRRMVKENLLKFDATPLFPERIAYTVPYKLSDAEAALYSAVTEYVTRRVQSCRGTSERQARRNGRVCPDHLSTPACIFAGGDLPVSASPRASGWRVACVNSSCCSEETQCRACYLPVRILDAEDVEDLEEAPDNEVEAARGGDSRPGYRSSHDRGIEGRDRHAEAAGGRWRLAVRRSGTDTKWRELASLLGEIFTPAATRRASRQCRSVTGAVQPESFSAPEAGYLHRASRYSQLSAQHASRPCLAVTRLWS